MEAYRSCLSSGLSVESLVEESRKGSAKEFVWLRNENSWAFMCDLKFLGRTSTFARYNASQSRGNAWYIRLCQ